jgi:hypothetical protein
LAQAHAIQQDTTASRMALLASINSDSALKQVYQDKVRAFRAEQKAEFEKLVAKLKPWQQKQTRAAAPWVYGKSDAFEVQPSLDSKGQLVLAFGPTDQLLQLQLEQAVALIHMPGGAVASDVGQVSNLPSCPGRLETVGGPTTRTGQRQWARV